MPHEHIELAQTPNGEIGPRCNVWDQLTFNRRYLGNITCAGNTCRAGQIRRL